MMNPPLLFASITLFRSLMFGLLFGAIASFACAKVVEVSSLEELRPYLDADDVAVRLAPGTYQLDSASSHHFLDFTGNRTHFDFTGVKLVVDTRLYQNFKLGINILALSGNDIVLDGLELETIGDTPPPGGVRAISMLGDRLVVQNVSVLLRGSYPYGYGSYFGIGSGAAVDLHKANGIRIGGIDNQLIHARVTMRAFGHAIFVRGAHNAVIRDCHVEGALRRTDDILAETSGLAFDRDFTQYTGIPIPQGQMTSLSEDGIRAYPDDPVTGRRTTNVTVENCTVNRMRRGICMAFATGKIVIRGCRVTACERSGFHIGSNTLLTDSAADALHTQALDISSPQSRDSRVRLMVLDSREAYGNSLLAKINGTAHDVALVAAITDGVPPEMTVELATDRGFGEGRIKDASADQIRLVNRTPARVVLHPQTVSCEVESNANVQDFGDSNRIRIVALTAAQH